MIDYRIVRTQYNYKIEGKIFIRYDIAVEGVKGKLIIISGCILSNERIKKLVYSNRKLKVAIRTKI